MPATERPKSRLENGKPNPAYTAWRKAQKVAESPVAVMEAAAEILTLKGTKTTKNAMFVMATSPDEAGCSIAVRLLKKGTGAKFIKKDIKVERRDGQFFQIR